MHRNTLYAANLQYASAAAAAAQALHNVTTLTRATTVSAFQTLSYISEGCIFIYMGMDTLDPIKWKVRSELRRHNCTTAVSARPCLQCDPSHHARGLAAALADILLPHGLLGQGTWALSQAHVFSSPLSIILHWLGCQGGSLLARLRPEWHAAVVVDSASAAAAAAGAASALRPAPDLACIFVAMQNTYPSELVWLFVTLLVLLLFGRALYVVPFALLHNMWSPEQLSPRDIVVVWCASVNKLRPVKSQAGARCTLHCCTTCCQSSCRPATVRSFIGLP